MKRDPYRPGDPFRWCMRCGSRYHASETKLEWDKLVVCNKCWEPRPMQLFTKIPVFPHEGQSIKNPSPEVVTADRNPIGPLDYAGLDPRKP